MQKHYIRLLTDISLNDKQQDIWYDVVNNVLANKKYDPTKSNVINQLNATKEELEGDDDFPFVYVVYVDVKIDSKLAERIVKVWNKIYPADYEIESSAEFDGGCPECEIEMDDDVFESIKHRISKFLHNRWVDTQLTEGWRFGLIKNIYEKTHPGLRDWDTLNEQYRKELDITKKEAFALIQQYPYI